MTTTSNVIDALGFSAGILVALSSVPQIYRVHKRGRATDLSGARLIYIVTGVAMQLTYLMYHKMWAVSVPLTVELVSMIYLTGVWAYMEHFRSKGPSVV